MANCKFYIKGGKCNHADAPNPGHSRCVVSVCGVQEYNKIPPIELIEDYREALKHKYGDDIARESNLYYSKGWFYVNIARRFPDGSVGTIDPADGMRRKDIEQRIKTLTEGK